MLIDKDFHLGTEVDPTDLRIKRLNGIEIPLILPWEDLKVHGLLNGASGSGKSRTVIAMALAAFDQNIPTVVIDKHGVLQDGIHLIHKPFTSLALLKTVEELMSA